MNLQQILSKDVGGSEGPGDYYRLAIRKADDAEDDDMSQLPVVDDHEQRLREVAEIALASPDDLRMDCWHSMCGTNHCIGGWAIHLAGDEGARLEDINGPEIAAYILLGREAYGYFYSEKEDAIAWLRQVQLRP